MKNTLALVALASCISAACRAATPAPVPENLLACGKLQDPGERVRCYDTQIAAMKASTGAPATPASSTASQTPTTSTASAPSGAAASTTPAAGATTPAAAASTPPATGAISSPVAAAKAAPLNAPSAAAAPPQSSVSQFGEEDLPPAARPAKAQKQAALLSSITAMRAVAPETYAISLANGQVWRQEEATQMSMFFHVGDYVRIEKGALGSYHMSAATTSAKNWVRVTRIQ